MLRHLEAISGCSGQTSALSAASWSLGIDTGHFAVLITSFYYDLLSLSLKPVANDKRCVDGQHSESCSGTTSSRLEMAPMLSTGWRVVMLQVHLLPRERTTGRNQLSEWHRPLKAYTIGAIY